MLKAIASILIPVGVFLVACRVGASLLVYEQATVMVDPAHCSAAHKKVLQDGDYRMCQMTADLSTDLLSGDSLMRLDSGAVVQLPHSAIRGAAWTRSHYSIGW